MKHRVVMYPISFTFRF